VELAAYLDRIGYSGPVAADLPTLRAVHRAHLLAIPYENLDVQFGRPVTLEPADAFAKIVDRRRGGWCYEMNGLLGAMLQAIGFRVTRMAGAVYRVAMGEEMIGNHLVLRVDLDEPWIADAGFGDGPHDPFPIREGAFTSDGFDFSMERIEDGWWRFHNHEYSAGRSFDFRPEPADPALLAAKCAWLQSAPESPFVMTATCQRATQDGYWILRGRSLKRVRPTGVEERFVGSADEFVSVLKDRFRLDLPEAADLWPRICARHEAILAAQAAAAVQPA
jgi:N-hydroxyarylamine O-acetyltransferase